MYIYGYYQRLILLSGDIELHPGPNNLSICHVNIRGLSSAKLLAIKHDLQHKFDIITISEIFLSQTSNHDLHLTGYHPLIRRDRDTFGGGVAVYLSNNLSYKHMHDIELPGIECLWLEITSKFNKFILAVAYRPPNADFTFWENLESMCDDVNANKNRSIILTGDLNADPNTRNGDHLQQFTQSKFLTIHITEPTRITETSATILDRFITNIPDQVSNVCIHPPLSTNDHCTISIDRSFKMHKTANYLRHIWLYKNADFEGLNNAIRLFNWNMCFENNDVDDILERWTSAYLKLAKEHIPNRVVTIRPNDKQWFSSDLRKLKKDKDKAHIIAKRTNSAVDWNNFRMKRNTYVGKLREAEMKYKQNLASNLELSRNINPKKWWQISKQFL
jgi:hypothetical protein